MAWVIGDSPFILNGHKGTVPNYPLTYKEE